MPRKRGKTWYTDFYFEGERVRQGIEGARTRHDAVQAETKSGMICFRVNTVKRFSRISLSLNLSKRILSLAEARPTKTQRRALESGGFRDTSRVGRDNGLGLGISITAR